MTTVPNKHPSITNVPYRIALIGEAPGEREVELGEPFVGTSGWLLNNLLSKASVMREACFVGNVCQHRPPGNDIDEFAFDGPEIQSGLTQLKADLERFKPNICLLLGKTALRAASGQTKIGDWRGSLFAGNDVYFNKCKCIASYHPAACLRQYEWTQILKFDIKKCRRHAITPDLVLPQRDLEVNLSLEETLYRLERIKAERPLIALDIEGGIGTMSCLSIATSATTSFIVPFANLDGSSFYANPSDEMRIWRALSDVLENPLVPKVLQNSLYDRFVLQYSYHIVLRGVVDDTMLKHYELYCELEKSLAFQASIYTDEPFYKSDRKSDNRDTFFRYCCRDSAVTYEINAQLDRFLDEGQRQHYKFNVGLLNPILYMELRGIQYDAALARKRLNEVNHLIWELQLKLDKVAGVFKERTKDEWKVVIRETMCYKKDPTQPKKEFVDDHDKAMRILVGEGPLTSQETGFLNIACGLSMNIKSKDFKSFLYDEIPLGLALPKQYKKDPKTGVSRLSTDYESLLNLKKKTDSPVVDVALSLGSLRTRAQMLEISADRDGRIRCGYNIVGTETGRLTSYTSPTGSGYNLQTIPAEDSLKKPGHPLRSGMRDLFVADKEHYVFQCDLAGADGWTVAAHLAALGDSTMLDDYRAGIKPAKVLCFLLRHGASSLHGKSRDEIKSLTAEVKKEDWDYFCSKIGQHGSCYLLGPIKLANLIFVQSEGQVNVSAKESRDLQELFFVRYRVRLWHNWMQRQLAKKPELICDGGAKRRFFGRKTEILGEALAHEPQFITTRATNLALRRLWIDEDNRVLVDSKLRLRIEPLHTIHDAILGQFKIEDTSWALPRIRSYFNNEIMVAGMPITIPFDGAFGTNWALDENSRKGVI